MIESRNPMMNETKLITNINLNKSTGLELIYCCIGFSLKNVQITPKERPATQIIIPISIMLVRISLPYTFYPFKFYIEKGITSY